MNHTYKVIRVNRLDEPGPMVTIQWFESIQDAKAFLNGAGGLVMDSEGTIIFQIRDRSND